MGIMVVAVCLWNVLGMGIRIGRPIVRLVRWDGRCEIQLTDSRHFELD